MKNRTLLIIVALVVAGVAWFLFRPERIFINRTVNEALPIETTSGSTPTTSVTVSEGMFHGVAHETMGTATILRLLDGTHVLRLTGFETSNGPDVQVYLGKAADATDNETVTTAGFFHVGALKGNIGDQNYALPSDLDLSEYRSVTIWCRRFGVNFGTAPLS